MHIFDPKESNVIFLGAVAAAYNILWRRRFLDMKMNIFAKCILQFTKQAQAKGLLGRLDCGHNIQPLVLFLKVVQVKYWPLFSSPSLNWQYSVQKDQWLTYQQQPK